MRMFAVACLSREGRPSPPARLAPVIHRQKKKKTSRHNEAGAINQDHVYKHAFRLLGGRPLLLLVVTGKGEGGVLFTDM